MAYKDAGLGVGPSLALAHPARPAGHPHQLRTGGWKIFVQVSVGAEVLPWAMRPVSFSGLDSLPT